VRCSGGFAAAAGLGGAEAVAVGAGLEDVGVEGDAVDDGGDAATDEAGRYLLTDKGVDLCRALQPLLGWSNRWSSRVGGPDIEAVEAKGPKRRPKERR
jgi:hypothetical protein